MPKMMMDHQRRNTRALIRSCRIRRRKSCLRRKNACSRDYERHKSQNSKDRERERKRERRSNTTIMVKQQTNKKYGAHLVKTFRKQQQEQTIYLICIKNHQ